VDPDEVWVVVDRDIPALREEVVTLLSALTGTEGSGILHETRLFEILI
jgi:hypothetical protein